MMALDLEENTSKPPRILIYGPQKIGKSSFGALADRPIFIQAEDGLDKIKDEHDIGAFKLSKNFENIMTNLQALAEEDHKYKTVVVDSLDWMEPLVWQHLIKLRPFNEKGRKIESIEDYGYGKGYSESLSIWQEYIDALNYLRDERGMTVIQIAHAQIRKFENPETDIYDRYELKLNKAAAAKMMEHSDIILFANYQVGTKKEEKNMSKDGRKRAVGTGERVLYTEERPAFMAGNRYSLPAEIPFTKDGSYWGVIAEHVPFFNQTDEERKHG